MRAAGAILAVAVAACVPAAAPNPTQHAAPTATLSITTAPPTPSTSSPAFRYVAIGASDTVGIGATDPRTGSWPARVAARLPRGSEYVNLGVSGSLATQSRAEQLPRAIELRPQLVTIWLAVNDLNAGIAPTEYAAALGAIVDPLVARTDALVFVGSVPDLRAVPAYAGTDLLALGARVTAFNAAIAAVGAAYPGRLTVVDLFTGSAALTSTITVSADGFHPSDAGYALIAERFLRAIAAAGIALG